jgi:hypothetical protein
LIRQVTGFKTFDKDSYKREDDLLDAAVYSVLVSLGDGTEARWSQLKTRERSAGNPHAAFDAAEAGNGAWSR